MTENKIDFENPNGAEIVFDSFRGRIKASEWKTIEEAPGVRSREWMFEDIESEIVDGALVEVSQGHRTPIQYLETDHKFEENIQAGEFLVFQIDGGGLSVYQYKTDSEVSFALETHKGEIMCLYVLKESGVRGEIVECERPGFSSAKLVTVPHRSKRMEETEIPDNFWVAIEMLDKGIEENLPVEIMDLNEESPWE